MLVFIEKNPFRAKNQTLRSYQSRGNSRQWCNYRFEPGWENVAEGGPLAKTLKKSWKIIVNQHVNVYNETRNHQKTLQKTQKATTYWKPREHLMPKYNLSGARFLHLAGQEAGSHPCSPVSYAADSRSTTSLGLITSRGLFWLQMNATDGGMRHWNFSLLSF